MPIANPTILAHTFLANLPGNESDQEILVEGTRILEALCERIEAEQPRTLPELFALTHAAVEELNAFEDDIDTVVREELAEEFGFIADTYGFADYDIEELIAPREW